MRNTNNTKVQVHKTNKMSSNQSEFIGVVRANGGSGQTLLASVFTTKTSLNKQGVERHFIETCSKEQREATLKSKKQVPNTDSNLFVIYNPKTQCFIGCAAGPAFAERLAWDVLRAATTQITQLDGSAIAEAKPLGLNRQLRDPLLQAMSGSKDDKLMQAQNKVDATKDKMTDNMQKMVQNYDNLQDLEAQVQDLEYESKQYQNDATKLKYHALKQYWWAVALVAAVILIILIAIICSVSS